MPNEKSLLDDRPSIAPRQIAILLASLPERTHRVLLGQLATQEKQAVIDELLALGEVDALERYRVLKLMFEQLQAETQSVEKVESEIQDEIQIGRARVSKKRAPTIYRHCETAAEPPAANAADNTPQPSQKSPATAVSGGAPLAHPADHVTAADAASEDMFAQFQQTQAAGVLPLQSALQREFRDASSHAAYPVARERPAATPSHAVSAATPVQVRIPVHGNALPNANAMDSQAEELAERVDLFLTQLSPQQLCRALGMASTKQAFLVLCGLPNETAERVLDLLPRRQSRKVRQDMRRMGRLQLSEIDHAKQVVAEIALRIAERPEALAA